MNIVGILSLCASMCLTITLGESDHFVDRLVHMDTGASLEMEVNAEIQKRELHLPLAQNERGEPIHAFSHEATTACKGAVLPPCTDHSTRVCDEGRNNSGANRCSSNADCISGRTCSPYGWCQGVQDVVFVDCSSSKVCRNSWLPACTDRATRLCDEGKNNLGANKCKADEDCINGRTCSFFGWCQGTQTVTVIDCAANTICQGTFMPACTTRTTRACDEGKNNLGANKCKANEDCVQGRTCSYWGWCQGTQNLAVSACSRRLSEEKHATEAPATSAHLTYCKGALLPTCTQRTSRVCSEETNSWGPSRCNGHEDCTTGRSCTLEGVCDGQSNAMEVECTQ